MDEMVSNKIEINEMWVKIHEPYVNIHKIDETKAKYHDSCGCPMLCVLITCMHGHPVDTWWICIACGKLVINTLEPCDTMWELVISWLKWWEQVQIHWNFNRFAI